MGVLNLGFGWSAEAAACGRGEDGDFAVGGGAGEFGDVGGEKVRGGGAGGGELRFQRVHQRHQLLHFGHDPALFGERFVKVTICKSAYLNAGH